MIVVLIALLAVGWLTMTQLQKSPVANSPDAAAASQGPIQAPQRPDQIEQFDKDINKLYDDQAKAQQDALREATQ
ncbi:hypothetical protein A11A3_04325 [Alcanivorax hongdengensis A-11-3]|uniref:Uncharacterized protein n=2 Tax=Alcanivorax hongdengensis TaxID=519051 RepID=L0WH57_9GAMM|nr:hypothetical protein A11A3_04325 [Alcanivorax hongdengensis A-11-3]